MASSGKLPTYSGKGDVNNFIVKMELHIKLKELTGESAAWLLASRLEEPAFNVYMRLTDDEKKDVAKLKAELRKQYETGNRDREEAMSLLSSLFLKEDESLPDFAFQVKRLVKLAYPRFSANDQQIHERDAFVRGLHPDMQLKIKTMANFATLSTNQLVDSAMTFEVAGVKTCMKKQPNVEIKEVSVEEKCSSSTYDDRLSELEGLVANLGVSNFRGRQRGRGRGNRRNNQMKDGRKCWNCKSQSHVVAQCPNRYCQSCAGKGHDAWQAVCPNHS